MVAITASAQSEAKMNGLGPLLPKRQRFAAPSLKAWKISWSRGQMAPGLKMVIGIVFGQRQLPSGQLERPYVVTGEACSTGTGLPSRRTGRLQAGDVHER